MGEVELSRASCSDRFLAYGELTFWTRPGGAAWEWGAPLQKRPPPWFGEDSSWATVLDTFRDAATRCQRCGQTVLGAPIEPVAGPSTAAFGVSCRAMWSSKRTLAEAEVAASGAKAREATRSVAAGENQSAYYMDYSQHVGPFDAPALIALHEAVSDYRLVLVEEQHPAAMVLHEEEVELIGQRLAAQPTPPSAIHERGCRLAGVERVCGADGCGPWERLQEVATKACNGEAIRAKPDVRTSPRPLRSSRRR